MKEKIIIKKNNHKYNKNTHFEGYTKQFCLALIHLSQGLALLIFTIASLQYFSDYLSLAFLEGYCPSLSLVSISLCLDLTTWDPSFLFFSSANLCLSPFSLAFSSASLLAF